MIVAALLFAALFDSPHEASGDYARLATEWAAFAAANRDSPEAELVLARLGEIAEEAGLPLSALRVEKPLSVAAGAGNGSTALRAAHLLARIRRERGDYDGARAILARAGYILAWAYCGPFGFSGAGSYGRAFEPERSLAFDAEYDSCGWPGTAPFRTRWKRLLLPGPGDPALEEIVWPRRGCAYLLAQFRTKAACEARVEIGCRSWCKVWLNGGLVLDRDPSLSEGPLHARLSVRLGEGWTGILAKVPLSSDLSVRLVDASLRPLKGVKFEEGLVLREWSDEARFLGVARDTPAAVDALKGTDGPAKAMHALALHYEAMDGEATAELESMDELPPSALSAHARIIAGWADAPESWRKNRSRSLYAKALEKGEFVPARLGLSRMVAREGKHKEALEELGKAFDKFPDSPLVKLEMASITREAGWLNEARSWMSDAEKLLPKSVRPHLFWSSLYEERGNNLRAASELRKAVSLDSSGPFLRALAGLCERTNEWSEAAALRRRLTRLRPHSLRERLNLASVLLEAGKRREALALYRSLVSAHPDHPEPIREMGEGLVKLGCVDEALECFEKAVLLKPDEDGVRRLAGMLKGEEEDFAQAYALDVRECIRRSENTPRDPRANRWLILDQTVIRLDADGSYAEYTHWAQKILSPDGIEDLKQVSYRGEIVELRNIRPDGTVLEPTVLELGSEVTIPGLEVGSTVECRYRYSSPAPVDGHVRLSPWYFQGPDPTVPHLVSDYIVIVPEGMNLRIVKRNWRECGPSGEKRDPLPDPDPAEQDGCLVYRWTVRNMPSIRTEPGMEDRETFLPHIEIATPWTPAESASHLASRRGSSGKLTPAIRARAEDLLSDAVSGEARARAAYEFVCGQIKGDEGPRSANAVLLSRSGDRNLLLAALLRAMGLDARFARARPPASRIRSDAGFAEPAWELFTPAMFVYGCVCVLTEGSPIWLDASNRYMPFGVLPGTLQGGTALLEGGLVLDVPGRPDASNGILTSLSLDILGDGTALAEGREEILGATGASYKRALEGRDSSWKNSWLQDRISERLPGAEVLSFSMPGLQEPGTPFRVEYALRLRGTAEGGKVRLYFPKLELSKLVTEAERNFPRKLSDAIWRQDVVEVQLSGQEAFSPLPAPLAAKHAFGSFSLSFSGGGRKAVVRRVVHVPRGSIAPERFGEFARFCRECDAAEETTLPVLARKRGGAAE